MARLRHTLTPTPATPTPAPLVAPIRLDGHYHNAAADLAMALVSFVTIFEEPASGDVHILADQLMLGLLNDLRPQEMVPEVQASARNFEAYWERKIDEIPSDKQTAGSDE